MSSSFLTKLQQVLLRYKDLGHILAQGCSNPQEFAKISKEYSDLTPIAEAIESYFKTQQDMGDLKEILDDPQGETELKAMAREDWDVLKERLPIQEKQVKILLLPKDEADKKNAILEIRAGTGGEEAALFAGDLSRMYQRYAELQGWKTEILSLSDSERGGFKECILTLSGTNVFSRLKFESGVHRVQRVPETESSGRIHTSAATVAVLPEAEDIDIQIDEKDLRIDVYRSSGPGGQSVNTTDSAVRITHLPTGIVVQQQDEKSQHKNRAKALRILKTRIYDHQRSLQDAARSANRKGQVGTGDRSERIRTYNFPQGRVTDHRINLTVYKIEEILNGSLDCVIDPLIEQAQADSLSNWGEA